MSHKKIFKYILNIFRGNNFQKTNPTDRRLFIFRKWGYFKFKY